MLDLVSLNAWYGSSHVLQGIDLQVWSGELVALVGRNGAGKTTTLKSIMGLLDRTEGRISWQGQVIDKAPVHQRFAKGIAYVPEERRIVPGLTVRENLELGLASTSDWKHFEERLAEIAELFPRLKERLPQEGVTMSGGEQQMLAIARALIAKPKLLLLDEPSEGVMPILVDEMFEVFGKLKRAGLTILLVEQNVELALELADRAYILDHGHIVHHAPAAELLKDPDVQQRYCAV